MSRFKKFNEMLFESYCKKSVSNAAKKERQKKAARGLMEQSLSELTDAALYGVVAKSGEVEQPEEPCRPIPPGRFGSGAEDGRTRYSP